jgi:hypothetical protein
MTDRLTLAKARADAARARFKRSLEGTQARLKPKPLAEHALAAARRQPVAVAGAVAGALLYLFRKPIFGAVKRLTKETKDA